VASALLRSLPPKQTPSQASHSASSVSVLLVSFPRRSCLRPDKFHLWLLTDSTFAGRGDSPNEDETPLKQNAEPKKQSPKSFLPHFKKAFEDARNQSNIAITTNTAPAVTVLDETVETTQSVTEEQAQSSATSIPCPDTNDDSHVKVLQPAVGKISDETASIGPHSRSVSLR